MRFPCLSADGRLALSEAGDDTLRLWDVASGQCRAVLEGHVGAIMACALSADGRLALSGSADHTLRLWDVASGQCRAVLEGHGASVDACALSADGHLAASVSWDQTFRLWSPESAACLTCLDLGELTYGLALSPDGRLAVVGGGGGHLHCLELHLP